MVTMVRSINVAFEDAEFERLNLIRKNQPWREFILESTRTLAQVRNLERSILGERMLPSQQEKRIDALAHFGQDALPALVRLSAAPSLLPTVQDRALVRADELIKSRRSGLRP
jgi:hypothetical protein